MRIEVKQMSNEELLRQMLDAIPCYIFLMDSDCVIQDCNAAAGRFLGQEPHQVLRRGGFPLHPFHGCGRGVWPGRVLQELSHSWGGERGRGREEICASSRKNGIGVWSDGERA